MAWTDIFRRDKANPVQESIAGTNSGISRENVVLYTAYYERIEVVNRGVNLIVDAAASIPHKVGDRIKDATPVVPRIRASTVELLLNAEPNPYQDIATFRANLLVDFIVDGNMFIYWDGANLYHIPANQMQIIPDKRTYVQEYRYGTVTFKPTEIIHVKENSFASLYRGTSRLQPAVRSLSKLSEMNRFQENFFTNGAVPGIVLKSPNNLGEKLKERMLTNWRIRYNPSGGGRNPMILDGGMEIDSFSNVSFRELDFEASIEAAEKRVLKALGVPPILLDSGNNANIKPNLRMFYLETVLPILNKVNAGYSRFFGFEIWEDATHVAGLQPEMSELASYFASLVNVGLLSPNEARFELGKPPVEGHDDLRVPANIAGSATNPSTGGRPTE